MRELEITLFRIPFPEPSSYDLSSDGVDYHRHTDP
jgi:hypothetical protein